MKTNSLKRARDTRSFNQTSRKSLVGISLTIMQSITAGAVALLLPSMAQAVDPKFAQFCEGYATEALQIRRQMESLGCDISAHGTLFDPNRKVHFDWCLTKDGAYTDPTAEGLKRWRALKECKDPPPAPPPGQMTEGIDLFGSDFSNLIARNPGVCMQACNANPECRAWTFVNNGSKCFLKNSVPAARSNACCVSGVKQAVDVPPPPPPPPPPPNGGAQMTCTIEQAVDVCPTTDGCNENTRIGVLEAVGTVTVFERQGPWHKVKLPAGEGWAFSGEGYVSLKCPG